MYCAMPFDVFLRDLQRGGAAFGRVHPALRQLRSQRTCDRTAAGADVERNRLLVSRKVFDRRLREMLRLGSRNENVLVDHKLPAAEPCTADEIGYRNASRATFHQGLESLPSFVRQYRLAVRQQERSIGAQDMSEQHLGIGVRRG